MLTPLALRANVIININEYIIFSTLLHSDAYKALLILFGSVEIRACSFGPILTAVHTVYYDYTITRKNERFKNV
jgi:hypothetical protein